MRKTITRDILVTTVRAVVYSVEADTTSDKEIILIGIKENDSKLMKALLEALPSDGRLVHVKETTTESVVCTMSLEDFYIGSHHYVKE